MAMVRHCIIAGLVPALIACGHTTVSPEGRPCDSAGKCLEGYVCDVPSNTCVSVLTPSPPFVTDLHATAGDKTVTLTFTTPNATFSQCEVLRKTGGYPTAVNDPDAYKVSASITTQGPAQVTDTNVTNGVTYYYLAVCQLGLAWSDEARSKGSAVNAVSSTPLDPMPKNPTDFTVSGGTGQATLHFTMPVGQVSECVVQRATGFYPTSHSDGTRLAEIKVTGVQALADDNLRPGSYYYAVFCNYGTTWNETIATVAGSANAGIAFVN